MNITLKLYATLQDYLPASAKPGNRTGLTLPEGATVAQALESLAIPLKEAHIIMINGRLVQRGLITEKTLREADELAVWPAIGGG